MAANATSTVAVTFGVTSEGGTGYAVPMQYRVRLTVFDAQGNPQPYQDTPVQAPQGFQIFGNL